MECTNYFMQKESQFDPAFATAKSKCHQKKELFRKAKPRRAGFRKLLQVFTTNSKDKEIRQFDIDRKFRWEDVQTEADAALQAYTAQVSFRRHPLRYLSRSFTQNASTLEALLQFVPDGEFTFVICGALTLVFNAAKRLAQLRQMILNCLEILRKVVMRATAYREIYSEDEDLLQAAENLYVGILDGVESMLQWLDESAFKKAVKALFQQDSYGKKIEEQTIKAGIEDAANEFREVAEICLHKSIRKQDKCIEEMVNLLSHMEKYWGWRSTTPHAPILIVGNSFIDVYGLQGILKVDQNLLSKDIALATSDAQRVSSPSFHAHSMTLLQHDRFQSWYLSNTSCILLVNGCMQLSPEQETTSPLTTVSWVLYRMLVGDPRIISLYYLCGQHTHPHDSYRGLTGMLRCLVGQLLFGNPERVSTMEFNHSFVRQLELNSLPALCQLLHALVTISPRRAIFMLIDGFSFVEAITTQQDLNMFVESLEFLITVLNTKKQTNQSGPVLKVLLINPTTSIHLDKRLRDCVIDLPENALEENHILEPYDSAINMYLT